MGEWTLFSNHGHVLVSLARNKEARLRDVAEAVGITERAVQKIVRELQQAGFIDISKHGRCNRYEISTRKSLRHELEAQCTVGRLLALFTAPGGRAKKVARQGPAPVEPVTVTDEVPAVQPAPSRKPTAKPEATQPQSTKAAEIKNPSPAQVAKSAEPEDPEDTRQQGSLF